MGFHFSRCNDLSIADLARLRAQGFSVGRSSHSGNLYPANLAMAATNAADMIMYDRVTGAKDRVSHPHLVIKGGKQERIACQHKMAVKGRVETTSVFDPKRVQSGEVVAECHKSAMQQAFPDATVMTQTDYLSANAELVWKILEEVGRINPHRFYRRIDDRGNIEQKLSRGQSMTWEALLPDIFGFTNSQSGWLQDNVLNVLVCAVVESVRTGSNVVYHTSGVDMDGYMDQMLPDLSSLYDHLVKRGIVPPRDLEFSLAVITPMRFCGDPTYASAMTELFETLKEHRQFESRVGGQIRLADQANRKGVIAQVSAERNQLKSKIVEIVQSMPGLMYRPQEANFYSQYDALNKGLFVLEEAVTTPLCELASMVQTVARILPKSN